MKKLTRRQPSDKPLRMGAIYCSPACGGSCTWEEYQSARDAADSAARQLGKAWTAEVWENLGWYARVNALGGYLPDFEGISIYLPSPREIASIYSVMAIDRTVGNGRTLRAAVRSAIKTMRSARAEVNRLLGVLEEVGG